MARRGIALAIALTSAGALAFEILLIRLFAIVDWHHLAFLVISLALLGYTVSGTFLALARERLLARFEVAASSAAAIFGATSAGAVLVWQRMEINSLEIFWSASQLGKVFLLYLLFAVPFFFAATAIGLALTKFGSESTRLYRADLVGGGVSAAAVTALLFVVHPLTALQLVAATGFVASAFFLGRRPAAVLPLIGIVAIAVPVGMTSLEISDFKELSYALRVPQARVIDGRSSPLALLTVVESPAVPFRHAPGLSLAFTGDVARQLGIFSDGGGMSPIVMSSDIGYLDALPTAVAYHAGTRKRHVAVIGAGGGSEVLSALAHGAERVTAVEMNRDVVELTRKWSRVYDDPRVRAVVSEGRRHVRASGERYDAIQIALVGSHGGSAAGVQALSETYLYTIEAMRELVDRLRPGGYLVITRWMQAPPRDVVKLLATASLALDGDAPKRVALLRGWNTATVLVKNGTLGETEVAALRRFCDERSFDLDYAPGVKREETNQFNILDEPYLFDAATAIFGGDASREDFLARYKFNVRPATDECPYFFHSFRWTALPELLRLRARGGVPLLEWGYLVLVIGLAQALVAAVVFILVPLFLFGSKGGGARSASGTPGCVTVDEQSGAGRVLRVPILERTTRGTLVAYFGSIGLAFLFVEIAFIQRLTLFTGNPLVAVSLSLTAFLVFAGLGSGFSSRLSGRTSRSAPLIAAAAVAVALVVLHFVNALPDPGRTVLCVALIAPLAFAMGMPFPSALRRLEAEDIPWAWGINGTASVLASMLATLIAVHFGFSLLVATAAVLYCVAGWSGRRLLLDFRA